MVAILDVFGGGEYQLDGDEYLVGRSDEADIRIADPGCSRRHFKLIFDKQQGVWSIQRLSASTVTKVNGRVVSDQMSLPDHCDIHAGTSHMKFKTCRPEQEPKAVLHQEEQPMLGGEQTVMAGSVSTKVRYVDLPLRSVPLGRQPLRLGRDAQIADVELNHCHVSRSHAEITFHQGQYRIRDLGSANGTLLNGSVLRSSATLQANDRIRIGPYVLEFRNNTLHLREALGKGRLVCQDVSRCVRGKSTGHKILKHVSLGIHSSEFVCLLGPTGSGKSTLLSTMCLRNPPDEGRVWLNDMDLTENFDFLKNRIAVVPQKEILHSDLTVEQALTYTAGMRLPPDTSEKEIGNLVSHMCDLVGLTEHRHKLFRCLSGGQAKRACLANEMIANPDVLFLDEVTAGLDEQTDREIMRLFRKVADSGKTVVAVTHNLAHVEETCDLLVILTSEGELAFVGPPSDAVAYFQVGRLGDIYPLLTKPYTRNWSLEFKQTSQYQTYVVERIVHQDNRSLSYAQNAGPLRLREVITRFARHSHLLLARAFRMKLADTQSLLAMCGQCLLVALLLFLLFGDLTAIDPDTVKSVAAGVPQVVGELQVRSDYSKKILFLLAICSFWFGCNNASKELVSERDIYTRERDVNLTVESYLASKISLLCAMSLGQVIVLFYLTRWLCELDVVMNSVLFMLGLTAWAGVGVGLAISALSHTEDLAVKLVPICLIPQIILGGILANVSGVAYGIAVGGIPTYWCFVSSCKYLPVDYQPYLGFDPEPTWLALLVLLGQGCLALTSTWIVLKYQQSRDGLYEYGIKQLRRGQKSVSSMSTSMRQFANRQAKTKWPPILARFRHHFGKRP